MKTAYQKLLGKIAHFQVEHPYLTLLLVLAVTIALYGGVAQVKTVASLEQMMPKQVEEIKAFNDLRDNYLGQDMIAVVVEIDRDSTDPRGIIDIRDKEVLEYIQYLKELLQEEVDIREAYAASDIITYAANRAGFNSDQITEMDKATYNMLLKNDNVQEQLSNFINKDFSISIIMATTDVSADDTRMKLLAERIADDIETVGHPPGIKIELTGTPIIQQKLGVLIGRDRKNTQNISLFFVFIITMILFGTFTSALVPIIVVTLSVNWLYGIMGYAGLPISTLAGGVAAMVIGIGIDYAIHLMNKFKHERKRGMDVPIAIEAAVKDTGSALTGAAVATSLAFLAFLLGSMPEMNRFGLLMAIGVSASFLLSIFGLPALLILEEKLIHQLKKHMTFGIEGEFELYEKDEVHPDDYEVVEVGEKELLTLTKGYKVCRLKKNKKHIKFSVNKKKLSKTNNKLKSNKTKHSGIKLRD